MKKKVFLYAVLGVAAVLVAGSLTASNMGFKLAYPLTTATPQNQNTIALPYNAQAGIVTAKDLIDDVGASTGVTPDAVSFYNGFDGFTSYTPPAPGNFPLDSGTGYLVKMPSATVYTIVGSHKPGFMVNLTTDTPQNQNFYAHIYHGTAADAATLLSQVGAAADAISFYNSLDGFNSYVPPSPGNFPLVPGEAYLIKVNAPVAFVQPHY